MYLHLNWTGRISNFPRKLALKLLNICINVLLILPQGELLVQGCGDLRLLVLC